MPRRSLSHLRPTVPRECRRGKFYRAPAAETRLGATSKKKLTHHPQCEPPMTFQCYLCLCPPQLFQLRASGHVKKNCASSPDFDPWSAPDFSCWRIGVIFFHFFHFFQQYNQKKMLNTMQKQRRAKPTEETSPNTKRVRRARSSLPPPLFFVGPLRVRISSSS